MSTQTADPTEGVRREEQARLNREATERAELELRYGQVWNRDQLQAEFTVLGFLAPYVAAVRIADGVKGSLEFQHSPRFYFNFQPHKE